MCTDFNYDFTCDDVYFTWTNGVDEVKLFRMMIRIEIDYPSEVIRLYGLDQHHKPSLVSLSHTSGYASCAVVGEAPIAYTTCNGVEATSVEFANFLKCIQNCVANCCPI